MSVNPYSLLMSLNNSKLINPATADGFSITGSLEQEDWVIKLYGLDLLGNIFLSPTRYETVEILVPLFSVPPNKIDLVILPLLLVKEGVDGSLSVKASNKNKLILYYTIYVPFVCWDDEQYIDGMLNDLIVDMRTIGRAAGAIQASLNAKEEGEGEDDEDALDNLESRLLSLLNNESLGEKEE